MDLINHSDSQGKINSISAQPTQVIIEASQMPDTVLKRLMEEVKNESVNQMFAYDRAHNRHNRGR
jgi:ABC-type hemin transport system substrate-binding protein